MVKNRRNNIEKRSYWTRLTTLEKCLFLTVIVLFIILLIVIFTRSWQKESNICDTPACVNAAADILSKIDLNVDPCEDFYLFSCGKFINDTRLSDYEVSVDSFSLVSDAVEMQIKTLLEKPVLNTDPYHITLVKHFYSSCMNTTRINRNSVKELKDIFEKLGGWPVLKGNQWVEEDWFKIYYQFPRYGLTDDIFFIIYVETDLKNSSRRVISLDQPYISYKSKMLKGFGDETVMEYLNYSIQLAKFFGADEHRAKKEIQQVLELHKSLAEILVPEEDRRDYSEEYNIKTIKELESDYPYIRWLELINNIINPIKHLTQDDTIVLKVPSYYEKLGPILVNNTARTLTNYMYWTALKDVLGYLGDDIRNIKFQFKHLSVISKRPPQWQECTYQIKSSLDTAVSSLYIRNFFKENAKKKMIEIVENIKNQFIYTLNGLNWMDDKTKNEAISKVKSMSMHIGYPDELLDNKKVDDYYKDLIIDPNSYLNCSLSLTKFNREVARKRFDKIVNKNDWVIHSSAAETNAFYDQNENSIRFPAGILQGIFFGNEKPRYLNYGAIGFIVGHEITHGFDDQGRQYDKDGNLRNWWPNKTIEEFSKKAKCIQNQYSNLVVPGTNIHINGINTQGENIADNGGIKHAYLAYENWSKNNENMEKLLPGLKNFTPKQLFWISAGNLWCSKVRTEQLIRDIDSQLHPPNYFRVNVPLMNNDDFAKDFSCPLGSKMNPPKDNKCIVW